MNSDLISRKALLDSMDKRYKEKCGVVQDNLAEGFMQMEKLIKEQPTAYDVDKVVGKVSDYHDLIPGWALKEIIENVKSGGIE